MEQDDSPGQLLADRIADISGLLDSPAQLYAYLAAVGAAVNGSARITADQPAMGLPVTAALLLVASTRADGIALATALVEAGRAHAAVWAAESQLAAFRDQLDGFDGLA